MILNRFKDYLKTTNNLNNNEIITKTNIKTNNILNNLLPISSKDIQEIKEKSDNTAKQILEKYPELFPIYKIKIDNFEFFISPRIKNSDKKLFFVNKNWIIEPRISRFSWSWWKNHIFPGYDSDNLSRFSKWDTTWNFDYESWVIADERIIKIFDLIKEEENLWMKNFTIDLRKFWYTTKNYEKKEDLDEFEKINISPQLNWLWNVVSLLSIKYWYNNLDENWKNKCKTDPLITMKYLFDNTKLDKKYFSRFLENNLEFWDWIKIEKIFLENWKEKYKIWIWEFEWKEISMIISWKNNLYYVEQFFIENSSITSYWIPKYRLSSGIFTAKPEEYWNQIPGFIVEDIEKKNWWKLKDNIIYPIVEYLQDNPFIVAFKKYKEKNFKK